MANGFILNRAEQIFCFEGKSYSKQELAKFKADIEGHKHEPSLVDLYDFLVTWFNDNDTIEVMTSGSTGTPKTFRANKNHMLASASRTCSFLALAKQQKALLCMPLRFIGAKMMAVRALIAGLDLYYVTPSLSPMQDMELPMDFVAMTPQQAAHSLKNPIEKERLQNIQHLLLGGMAVLPKLEAELKKFPNHVWLSYGMTETLSHIALRKLNGHTSSKYFTPLQGVELSLAAEERLVINDHKLKCINLITNDRANILNDGRFELLGRVDNVVNSGGIKIQVEEIENLLSSSFSMPFQISSLPHAELGEQLILCTEKPCPNWQELFANLPKYHAPKLHIILPKLPLTETGKPHRSQTKILAQEYFLQSKK